jgi:hypothetical protein
MPGTVPLAVAGLVDESIDRKTYDAWADIPPFELVVAVPTNSVTVRI